MTSHADPPPIRRLGLLTSGGDCPGLNVAIRAVVRRATLGHGVEVIGIEDAVAGLVERRTYPLSSTTFDLGGFEPMLSTGGSILGSLNRDIGDVEEEMDAGYRAAGIDALIAIGGDGSLGILHEHARRRGWRLVGIPKTIDNDVAFTDRSIGFDSAVNTVVHAMGQLRTTGVSHDRVMVLETMGRHAGHLALHAGIAGGADVILVPEIPYTLDGLLETIERTREARGHLFALVVVAEGAADSSGQLVTASDRDGRARLGGIGALLAEQIEAGAGGRIEARATVLGHLQRGGPPSPLDALLATALGVHAVDLAMAGRFDTMAAWRGGRLETVPLLDVVRVGSNPVDPASQLVETARAMGIYLGDPDAVLASTRTTGTT
ncbi:MAG: ATP-dependent 6-phosphofructokinase [Acidimicrobiales bacterium]|jgi:6-phosphofructokinase 1|nr:ATP-dependent 6-phosphofructokinase [Acidimicrobiales bacterium]